MLEGEPARPAAIDAPPSSQRWALGVEYDGSAFHGFQQQATAEATVQRALQQALTQVAAHPVQVVCAGRTDAGVHATVQVVHFDSPARRDASAWVRGTNSLGPEGVSVCWASPVPQHFHARFSARARRYLYLLAEGPTRFAIGRDHVTRVRHAVDVHAMHDAAQALLGEHDFSAFRAAGCQARSPVRELFHFDVLRHGSLVVFDVRANAFLQHMVRNLVGSLLRIGAGQAPVTWMGELLRGRDRTRAGAAAPAAGLYLAAVDYDPAFALDSGLRVPWFVDGSALRAARLGAPDEST